MISDDKIIALINDIKKLKRKQQYGEQDFYTERASLLTGDINKLFGKALDFDRHTEKQTLSSLNKILGKISAFRNNDLKKEQVNLKNKTKQFAAFCNEAKKNYNTKLSK